MSQYNPASPNPSDPYSGANAYAAMNPYASLGSVRPACKWAGILQLVVGGLLIVLSLCMGVGVSMLDSTEMPAETREQLQKVLGETGVTMEQLKFFTAIFLGACLFLPAVLMIVLGIFVMRGSKFGVITSIVLASIGALLLLAFIGAPLLGANPISVASNACMGALPLAGLGCLLVMLIRALRELARPGAVMAASSVPSAQAQYQQQWAAYYQQYTAWQQSQQQVPIPPSQPQLPAPGDQPQPPPQAPSV